MAEQLTLDNSAEVDISVRPDLGLVTRGDRHSWAVYSPCGTYRYALGRLFGDYYTSDCWKGAGEHIQVWDLLNPSSAGHEKNDPTVLRMIGYARRERAGGLIVVNAFAWRATDPKALVAAARAGRDVVGAHNEAVTRTVLRAWPLAQVIVGWGADRGPALRSGLNRAAANVRTFARPLCLGMTKDGSPRHPLYMRADAQLVKWGSVDG